MRQRYINRFQDDVAVDIAAEEVEDVGFIATMPLPSILGFEELCVAPIYPPSVECFTGRCQSFLRAWLRIVKKELTTSPGAQVECCCFVWKFGDGFSFLLRFAVDCVACWVFYTWGNALQYLRLIIVFQFLNRKERGDLFSTLFPCVFCVVVVVVVIL